MKTYHHESATRGKQTYRLRKCFAEFIEFTIDMNANGLKRARGRILVLFAHGHCPRNNFGEAACRGDRFDRSFTYNGACDTFGKTLFTVVTDYACDFMFLRALYPCGGGFADVWIHAHV